VVAVVMAAVAAAVAVTLAVAVVDSIAPVAEASMVAVDSVAVADLVAVGSLVVAASEAARDRLAEGVTPTAAGPKLAAISVRRKIVRRTFLPP